MQLSLIAIGVAKENETEIFKITYLRSEPHEPDSLPPIVKYVSVLVFFSLN